MSSRKWLRQVSVLTRKKFVSVIDRSAGYLETVRRFVLCFYLLHAHPGCQRFFLVGGDRIERRARRPLASRVLHALKEYKQLTCDNMNENILFNFFFENVSQPGIYKFIEDEFSELTKKGPNRIHFVCLKLNLLN